MEPILLKPLVSTDTLDDLILKGVNDLDIPQHQKDDIHTESMKIASPFITVLQTHLAKGKDPNEEYSQQITKDFQSFTEAYRQLFKELMPKDIVICFGMSSIWMGILNGLDAESGIMPNHPFKREIATCLRTFMEILDKR